MLRELRVENYAVIDNVAVEFGPGLNLLTGETGAGKSILIDFNLQPEFSDRKCERYWTLPARSFCR
ncbi:MAG: AAA family ATPase [Acidobacteriota bacterium]|nr:AAA family ATPase [Acidobacteriota bacterium]